MKKLVCSALALSATSAAGLASDSDWSSLDQQIEALTASLAVDNGGGPNMFGRLRAYYATSSDVVGGIDSDGDDLDLGGFFVEDARFGVHGQRGDYGYKLQVDFADGMSLLDAYADFPIGEQVQGRFGQFKSELSRSALVSSGKLAFIDRNAVGNLFSMRVPGFQIGGEFDALDWNIDIQNGGDTDAGTGFGAGAGDDLYFAGKVSFDVLGAGKDLPEGATGGTDEPSATVAIGFYSDGATEDGDGFIAEFHGGTNVYSFGLDVLSIGDGLYAGNGSAEDSLTGIELEADTTPISLAGTYMVSPDTWEVALRFQDYDNDNDESKIDLAVNNYLDGHNLKWTLQYSTTDSDDEDHEIDLIALQLALVF